MKTVIIFLGLILSINPAFAEVNVQVETKDQCVILLHGLIRSPDSMKNMQSALNEQGYKVINRGYPSTEHNIETLSKDYLSPIIHACKTSKQIHFITHSLGGILVREYLANNKLDQLGHVVMLGPPNNGSEIVDKIGDWKLFYKMHGEAGTQLGTAKNSKPKILPKANFSLGVIAGNWTIDPIGWLILPKPNDGKVSVESTKLKGMTDFKVMPYSHALMMKRKAVIDECIHFLQHGKFTSGTNISSN